MSSRSFNLIDRFLGEIDKAIKTLTVPARSSRETPAPPQTEELREGARTESVRLMRVNHSGEVAAQALYRGQAMSARRPEVAAAMRHAADEEMDHLAWCEARLQELNGRPSVLNPLWYAGSFAIGAVAGVLGDRTSLGFVAETERQVESHLHGHLQRLAPEDNRSRAILEGMARDEMQHGAQAASLGGEELPFAMRTVMRLTSRLMTHGSYWL